MIYFADFRHYQVLHSVTMIPTIDSFTRVWNIIIITRLLEIRLEYTYLLSLWHATYTVNMDHIKNKDGILHLQKF